MDAWGYRWFTKEECARACEQDDQVDRVDDHLLKALDQFRTELGARIVFSPVRGSLYATRGHAAKSYHYRGQAADLIFPDTPLLEAFFAASRFHAFGAIGIYPFWEPDPGLHVDIRAGIMRAYWWRDSAGEYRYLHQEFEIRDLFRWLMEAR